MKTFSHRNYLTAHIRNHEFPASVFCTICQKTFSNQTNLKRHMKGQPEQKLEVKIGDNILLPEFMEQKHVEKETNCSLCKKKFANNRTLSSVCEQKAKKWKLLVKNCEN